MTDNKTRPVTPTSDNKTKIVAGMSIQEDVLKLRIENEQLKAQNEKLEARCNELFFQVNEQNAQIEKMKCCTNCANCNDWGEYNEDNEDCNICKKHSKWKLGTLND